MALLVCLTLCSTQYIKFLKVRNFVLFVTMPWESISKYEYTFWNHLIANSLRVSFPF